MSDAIGDISLALLRLQCELEVHGLTLSGIELGGDDDKGRLYEMMKPHLHSAAGSAEAYHEIQVVGLPIRLKRDRERLERKATAALMRAV